MPKIIFIENPCFGLWQIKVIPEVDFDCKNKKWFRKAEVIAITYLTRNGKVRQSKSSTTVEA